MRRSKEGRTAPGTGSDRGELEAAARVDEGKVGHRVKAWLGALVVKDATIGGAVIEKVASGVITAAVLKYYNQP